MAIKIAGTRSARPDYSTVTTIPIAPSMPAKINMQYWNSYASVPAGTVLYFVPRSPENTTFPKEGKILKISKFVATCDADTLIGLELRHVNAEGWRKYLAGEIDFITLLQQYTYIFATEYGYQRIEIRPELYPISYPDVFIYGLVNCDPDNDKTVWHYWRGEEHEKG